MDATTDDTGTARIALGDAVGEVIVRDADSNARLPGVSVHAIRLATGTLVWAGSGSSTHFPAARFVADDGKPVATKVAQITIGLTLVALVNVGTAIYEYFDDPPSIAVERGSDGRITRECLRGDLSDVLALFPLAKFPKMAAGFVKVIGAPARIRGVTAINLGFTRKALGRDLLVFEAELSASLQDVLGLMDTDVKVFCWPVVDGEPRPFFELEVTRSEAPFEISRISALRAFPIAPSQDLISTTLSVTWTGPARFPVVLEVLNVVCYPGWGCNDGALMQTSPANPITVTWGCYGPDPTAQSGFTLWKVRLTDSTGAVTPFGTFSAKCVPQR